MTRADLAVLGAVTLYAAIVLVRAALSWHLGIDESWHLFYADIEPLWRAIREWGSDSHPPLTYILLRPIVALTTDPFWARLTAVVPALLQPWLLFAILRRLDVARPLAHAGVIVFTISQAFTVIGVVLRSYSIGTTFGMVAAIAALDLLQGRGASPRRKVVLLLAALALGIGSLYAVGLTAGAVGLAFWVATRGSPTIFARFVAVARRESRRPEWLAFGSAVGLTIAFYLITYLGREFHHLGSWLLEPGQSVVGFAIDGAMHDLADFTPLDFRGSALAPVIAIVIVITLLAAAIRAARRGDTPRGVPRATAIGGLLALAAVFLTLALLRTYPFGGDLRHQYPLFPLGVVVMCAILDDLYRALPRRALRAALCVAVIGVGAWTTLHSFRSGVPDFPSTPVWGPEAAATFEVADDRPVCFPNCAFVGLYGRYLQLGWRYLLSDDDGWEHLETTSPPRRYFRHRPTWSLDPVPDREFLASIRRLCERENERTVRVSSPRPEPQTSIESRRGLELDLAARCREAGLRLLGREVFASGEVYVVTIDG